MAKVTFVVGLCGSGKTHLSEQIARETGAEVFEGPVGKQKTEIPRLLQCLKSGVDCVVEEITFCSCDAREWIVRRIKHEAPGTQIEWRCYENDLEAANHNVRLRRNKGEPDDHISINQRAHSQYTYPDGCHPIRIFRLPLSADAGEKTDC